MRMLVTRLAVLVAGVLLGGALCTRSARERPRRPARGGRGGRTRRGVLPLRGRRRAGLSDFHHPRLELADADAHPPGELRVEVGIVGIDPERPHVVEFRPRGDDPEVAPPDHRRRQLRVSAAEDESLSPIGETTITFSSPSASRISDSVPSRTITAPSRHTSTPIGDGSNPSSSLIAPTVDPGRARR